MKITISNIVVTTDLLHAIITVQSNDNVLATIPKIESNLIGIYGKYNNKYPLLELSKRVGSCY